MESVRISSDTMKRLRAHLSKKHGGQMYGKITHAVNEAVETYITSNSRAGK